MLPSSYFISRFWRDSMLTSFSRDFNDRQIEKRALIFAIRTFYFSNNLNFLRLLDRLEQEKRTFKDSIHLYFQISWVTNSVTP